MTSQAVSPAELHERREHRLMLMLLAPALLIVVGILVLPLGWLAWQSIYQDGGFTLINYQRFFTEDVYWRTFLTTFRIAFVVTVASLLLGYPIAFVAAALPKRWSIVILAMVVLPFWTSVLVRAYSWLILLQRKGLINTALMNMGLIESPLRLVNNELGTVIATLHILLPFMVLPLYAAMQKIPNDLILAGNSLGGTPTHVFFRVFLPLSMPGVIAGMVLVFILSLGFYITPELLGGGRTYMVSMLVSLNIEIYNQWGAASAVAVSLLACVLIIFRLASMIIPFERIMGSR